MVIGVANRLNSSVLSSSSLFARNVYSLIFRQTVSQIFFPLFSSIHHHYKVSGAAILLNSLVLSASSMFARNVYRLIFRQTISQIFFPLLVPFITTYEVSSAASLTLIWIGAYPYILISWLLLVLFSPTLCLLALQIVWISSVIIFSSLLAMNVYCRVIFRQTVSPNSGILLVLFFSTMRQLALQVFFYSSSPTHSGWPLARLVHLLIFRQTISSKS